MLLIFLNDPCASGLLVENDESYTGVRSVYLCRAALYTGHPLHSILDVHIVSSILHAQGEDQSWSSPCACNPFTFNSSPVYDPGAVLT